MSRPYVRRKPADPDAVNVTTLGRGMCVYTHGRYVNGERHWVSAVAPEGLVVMPLEKEIDLGEVVGTVLYLVAGDTAEVIGVETIW